MNLENCIGIFDSGIGGLSIYKELKTLLPNETFCYLADSNNAPYGEKKDEEIQRLKEAEEESQNKTARVGLVNLFRPFLKFSTNCSKNG